MVILATITLVSLALVQGAAPCSSGIVYDDGTAETTWGTPYEGPDTVSHLLSRFEPPSYPYHFDTVCMRLNCYEINGGMMEAVVFDDDGPEGAPMSLLASAPAMIGFAPDGVWVTFHLDCGSIQDGVAWIGVRYAATQIVAIGADTDGTHPFYSSSDGTHWMADYPIGTTLMIRADGAQGSVAAMAIPRNGSGVNSACYSASRPLIGSTWEARVTHDLSAVQTFVALYPRGSDGVFVPAGEILVDLSRAPVYTSIVDSGPVEDVHSAMIPPDTGLIGITLTSQAAVRTSSGFELCNAYDLTIGCQ